MKNRLRNDVLPIALSAGAVVVTLVLQNALFLTTAGMLYVCLLVTAVELFSSLCLLYFSARLLVAETRRLFAAVFSPALVFSVMVLAGVPFNTLMVCTNVFISLLWCASLFCMLMALGKKNEKFTEQLTITSNLFSVREKEVIALVLSGKTVRETAAALFISEATVKTHLQHIYAKAGVKNRAELALFIHQTNG